MNDEKEEIPNTLIQASAGTGKTYSISTRIILLLNRGVRPEQIIGITFSRAAAREIYAKLLERLAEAARSEADAQKTCADIGKSEAKAADSGTAPSAAQIAAATPTISCAEFRGYLRQTIAAQHLGGISTIDSFVWRMIQHFPLELGFQGGVQLMDDYAKADALHQAESSLFATKDEKTRETFLDACHDMVGEEKDSRVFRQSIDEAVTQWQETLLANATLRGQSEESILTALKLKSPQPVYNFDDMAKRLQAAAAAEQRNDLSTAFSELAAFLTGYTATKAFPKSGKGKKLFDAFSEQGAGKIVSVKIGRPEYTLSTEDAKLVNDAMIAVFDVKLRAVIRKAAGITKLVNALDEIYDDETRRQGRLTFGDLYRQNLNEEDATVQNIEFRFDEKLDDWALDEFQDTSLDQWRALKRLVLSAGSGEANRSVTVVGDLKQAIYGWRGGSLKPFAEIRGQIKDLKEQSLDESWRYGQTTVDFINKVFSAKGLDKLFDPRVTHTGKERKEETRAPFLGTDWRDTLKAGWLETAWREHQVAEDRKPEERRDYVEIIGAELDTEAGENGKDKKTASWRAVSKVMRDIRAKQATWVSENPGQKPKGFDIAVLVRTNDQGQEVADDLKSQGINAVWEGESSVDDSPVVQALLSLIHLASHPSDTYDHGAAVYLPFARQVFPELAAQPGAPANGKDMENSWNALSVRVAADLAQKGLGRALGDYVKAWLAAQAPEAGADNRRRFTEDRLRTMVRAAFAFEDLADPDKTDDDFPAFLKKQRSRDVSAGAEVRVITIHRSKGLGFDCVILPLVGEDPLNKPKITTPLPSSSSDEDMAWMLPHVNETIVKANPVLSQAYERQCQQTLLDNLRLNYVATTRSKRALYVIMDDEAPSGKKTSCKFSSLIRAAFGLGEPGDKTSDANAAGGVPVSLKVIEGSDEDWVAHAMTPDDTKAKAAGPDLAKQADDWLRHLPAPATKVRMRTPSHAAPFVPETGAAGWFAGDGEAAEEGIRKHDELALNEWSVPKEAPGFAAAFTKPEGFLELWRERGFEIYENGVWTSGRFDRVVFFKRGGEKHAAIYDFKTNKKRTGETSEEFRARLSKAYKEQMGAYRMAVVRLTGIPSRNITTELLAFGGPMVIKI